MKKVSDHYNCTEESQHLLEICHGIITREYVVFINIFISANKERMVCVTLGIRNVVYYDYDLKLTIKSKRSFPLRSYREQHDCHLP